jgi:hypothetical protein
VGGVVLNYRFLSCLLMRMLGVLCVVFDGDAVGLSLDGCRFCCVR